MIGIKKVQVVPLDENYGKIIDSLNPATDDKTKNAPSINAVNNALSTVYTKTEVDTAIENNTTSIMSDVADDYLSKTDASSTYKLKGDFAVLTGNFSASASDDPGNTFKQTTQNINYPTGFSNTNCVCVAFGTTRNNQENEYKYDGSENVGSSSVGVTTGNLPKAVYLESSNIVIHVENIGSSAITIYYKIVLMKIS